MDIIANNLSATNAKITGNITVNGSDISAYVNKKIQETASTLYKFKGSVDTVDDLQPKEATAVNGDVWNIIDTNMNYAWVADTNEWDPLGSILDTTKFLTAEVDPAFKQWKNNTTLNLGSNANGAGNFHVAIGTNADTGSGNNNIAIGYTAKVIKGAYGAIQLGTGENAESKSLQFRSTKLVDSNGKIPASNLDTAFCQFPDYSQCDVIYEYEVDTGQTFNNISATVEYDCYVVFDCMIGLDAKKVNFAFKIDGNTVKQPKSGWGNTNYTIDWSGYVPAGSTITTEGTNVSYMILKAFKLKK